MSQDQRNESREEHTGRNNNDHQHKNHDGFEGMNYEQRRQPYQPRPANHNGQGKSGKHTGNDEEK
jgi:hypothetical protein